jgi:cysteine desulfurase / selenocysteine lyase
MDNRPTDHLFADFRNQFLGVKQSIYMDVAARGLVSTSVREAIDAYLDHRMVQGADKAWMFDEVEKARGSFARLIRVDPTEIAFTKNVSDGINAFASAIRWVRGDNVVICEALEHPANVYPWYNLKELLGIQLNRVNPENGQVPFERLIASADEKTRVITVSSVSFSPGARFPVGELGLFCRARGILLLVDAAQSIGILDTDVRALNIDALATSTQKGLLALYGGGFLYVRREVADGLSPRYLSRFGVQSDSHHEAASGALDRIRLAVGARRFDVGNYNFLAAIAVKHSLHDLHGLGIQNVENRVCSLATRLADGFNEVGLAVYGRDSKAQSHIVAVGNALSDHHDTTDDRRILELYSYLVSRGVKLTIRRGLLRFSLHAYNNEDDVEQVIELVQQWQRT